MANPRVKVTLTEIKCNRTEDDLLWTADEFYVIAAFAKSKEAKIKTNEVGIWKFDNGDVDPSSKHKRLPLVLFDEEVEPDETSRFVITCWDQDSAEERSIDDLKQSVKLAEDFAKKIGKARKLRVGTNPRAATSVNTVLDYIQLIGQFFKILGFLTSRDKDDLLGIKEEDISTPTWWEDYSEFFGIGRPKLTLGYLKCRKYGCDYDVRYQILVSP